MMLRKIANRLPLRYRQYLKQIYYRHQIRHGKFVSPEAEFRNLHNWVEEGDWVLDIGANIGHYSLRFSEIVGDRGRVFSFEPIKQTFENLTANIASAANSNISLFNVAVSDKEGLVAMEIPEFENGSENLYQAHIAENGIGQSIFCFRIDSIQFSDRIALAKIDVEGHEQQVLNGMHKLILRDKPVLIIEGRNSVIEKQLTELGYTINDFDGSPNRVFVFDDH